MVQCLEKEVGEDGKHDTAWTVLLSLRFLSGVILVAGLPEKGVDPNVIDQRGRTPLQSATER